MSCDACKDDEERKALIRALKNLPPGLTPIPTPDEEQLLNSGKRSQDKKLEKWLNEDKKRGFRTTWT